MPGLFDNEPLPERRAKPNYQREFRQAQLRKFPAPDGWRPDTIPELNGEKHIVLNAETTGLKWWDGDRPVGWSFWLPGSGRHGYLPMRHEGGGNHPVEQVHRFLGDLRGMHIDNTNTKFDIHMSREDGVDLVEQGNTFGDVAHVAALLDDHRRRFKLDALSVDILGWDVTKDGLGPIPTQITSEQEFQYLHASYVAPYAVRNVEQVTKLLAAFRQRIADEELVEVHDLEQAIIPVVVEMEHNGTYLDVDLLRDWQQRATSDLEDALHQIYMKSGMKMDSPNSGPQMRRLFEARRLPMPTLLTDGGSPSFAGSVLKDIPDECVQLAYRAKQLTDLKSDYLDKYLNTVRSDGWLRFNLHQLKSIKGDDDSGGTVSGRFSAAGDKFGGYNPQQVVAVEKQLERGWCPDYVIRKLFIAGPETRRRGGCMVSSDMMQVEYRLFAHYANMAQAFHLPPLQKMIGGKPVWVQGPLADFHALVAELLNNPKLNRKLVKNVNFAKIYGAGLIKFALMIGYITQTQYDEYRRRLDRQDWSVFSEPELLAAKRVNEEYDAMFPAVKPLIDLAKDTAEQRGFVKTLMGRRARLAGRFHSALNRVIQGGAADINKRVLIEVYKRRRELGMTMRLTVHDELMGDMFDAAQIPLLEKILNTQYFSLRAPILWDTQTGSNWAACK